MKELSVYLVIGALVVQTRVAGAQVLSHGDRELVASMALLHAARAGLRRTVRLAWWNGHSTGRLGISGPGAWAWAGD